MSNGIPITLVLVVAIAERIDFSQEGNWNRDRRLRAKRKEVDNKLM
jgi:hypothetical protein